MDKNFKLVIRKRPRRLRKSSQILTMCEETKVLPSNLVQPLFVIEGKNRAEKISSMPNIARLSIDNILRKCESLLKVGVNSVAIFPSVHHKLKSAEADEALNRNSLANKTIRSIKKSFPSMVVIADIALDPYTTHGHDGVLGESGSIENDETVEILCGMSVLAADAGADFVAPSDMMDGRIGAIRDSLDDCGFETTAIMSYAAKYASAFYGPFREAIGSMKAAGSKGLDKRSYQLNPANSREALKEALLDEIEGADVLMVKPAGSYLDIIKLVKDNTNLPIAAYQVSGEYAMICAAAERGFIDFDRAEAESLTSIKRAGADIILTYFAESFAMKFRA